MQWNWQDQNWPNFIYDEESIKALEASFLKQSGVYFGAYRHISAEDQTRILVGLLSDEALKTSEIEGEYLDRDSVQFSILKNLGLAKDHRKVPPAEKGIADMLLDLYQNFDETLTHELLFKWHEMLCTGRKDLEKIGAYRKHESPMQVASGRVDKPTIHYEAPPSKKVKNEMSAFIKWFNQSRKLPILIRAGLTHLYFVSIHPFEDGNGPIGRALSEKALLQGMGESALISLSTIIEKNKKNYYAALEKNNKNLEITAWLKYFAEEILQAQEFTQKQIDFIIFKAKYFEFFRDRFNDRQDKVLLRVFREGLDGFKGGLSNDNYATIAKTSSATATRDLKELVTLKALVSTGQFKSTRYHLNLNLFTQN